MVSVFLIYNGWGIFLLRIMVGLIFVAHGHRKIQDTAKTFAWLESEGFKPAPFWGWAVILSELLGGLLLILGLFTQIVALELAIVMSVATLYNFKKNSPFFKVLELDLLLLVSLILLATLDGGYFSLNTFFGIYF